MPCPVQNIFISYFNTETLDNLSEKDIKFQYGNILSAENMYVDKGNVLYQNGLASIYPILYHLQNGEITLREEISPENPEVLDHITLEE